MDYRRIEFVWGRILLVIVMVMAAGAVIATPAVTATQSTAPPPDSAAGPIDFLSWSAGAFGVRLDDPATAEALRAALDGDPRTVSIGIPRREPLPFRFVVELPALTTFETFAVPVINEFGPARGRHVRTIVVEGSVEGPDAGFAPLATLVLQMDRTSPQTFPVQAPRPVRWVRVEFVDRLLAPPSDVDSHVFSELMGYGVQEPIVISGDRFTGRWRYRRTGINDVPGTNTIELVQEGSSIRGCEVAGGRQSLVTGSVVDGLAHLIFNPSGAAASVPVLARVTEAGEFVGARFSAGFSAFWASPDAQAGASCLDSPETSNPIAETLLAGETAVIHGIHFDVDSDVLRADAAPALESILAALQAGGELRVTIEGHTDSDGSTEHNLDLSQRRAVAVVAWLTERGIAASRLSAEGLGESRPIADNESSAGKALNRRVEVRPN